MTDITYLDTLVLKAQMPEVLGDWYCILNSFDWPELLADPEGNNYVMYSRRSALMLWIKEHILPSYITHALARCIGLSYETVRDARLKLGLMNV